jgi:protein ImuB
VNTTSGQTLWLGLHCPALPLTAVWGLLPESGPVAVHDAGGRQARIVQASRRARTLGVHPGQALTDALALAPSLHSRPRSRPMETQALETLALLAYDYSHQVVLADDCTVLVEIAGSRRLHGDAETLSDRLSQTAREHGFVVRTGSAPVPAAARLLAKSGQHCPDARSLQQTLKQLSPTILDLPESDLRALDGCGLSTLGELMQLPAADRVRRFGPQLNKELAGVFGHRPVALSTWQPPECYRLDLELPAATADTAALLFVFRRAADHLGHWLRVRDQALVQLHARLVCEEGNGAAQLDIGLARPGQVHDRLLELIGLKLDALDLPAPVDTLELTATTTSAHRPPQADLFSGHNRADAWPALLDRLHARMGPGSVAGLVPAADHRPERSWAWTSPGTGMSSIETRPRPLWLLPEPQPCRRDSLQLEQGPERIESGWWEDRDCRRDYWIARDRHGRRLWVFHEHHPRRGWFLHGMMDM